jgi:hypothetical protein
MAGIKANGKRLCLIRAYRIDFTGIKRDPFSKSQIANGIQTAMKKGKAKRAKDRC